jgi:hypothetical protein
MTTNTAAAVPSRRAPADWARKHALADAIFYLLTFAA